MAWPYLKPSDMSQIRTCVDCAVDNSEAHKDELGHTDADKKKSTEKLSKKMQPSPNDQKEYLRIKYDRYSDRGQVGLVFQKMKWMSRYAWPRLGDVWVVSVVFEGSVLPLNGSDQEYVDFLNHLSDDGGPFREFLTANNVSSLFSVGPWQPNPPTKSKRIGQLELVGRTVWDSNGGKWTIQGPIRVNQGYRGRDSSGNDVRIPRGVVTHWARFSGRIFGLTELRFNP